MSVPLWAIRGTWAFSLAAGAFCVGAAANGKPDRVATGSWGGQGIVMGVSEKGAGIEYDCAHGSVDEVMKLDGDGRFEARGVHVREHPGPVREGELQGVPALYSGKVDGDTMTLTVKLAGSDEVVGTYTLTHGKRGRIRKCA